MRTRFASLTALATTALTLGAACGSTDAPLSSGGGAGSDAGYVPSYDAGTGTGTGTGTGGGGTDGGFCEVHELGNGQVAPDILIVLDRSGSMKQRGVNRWDPSVSALKTITQSLDGKVSFGLMTFPGTGTVAGATDCSTLTNWVDQLACFASAGGGGGGGGSCATGTVDVPIGPNNAATIASTLDGMQPGGATPTSVTLQAAHQALGAPGQGNIDTKPTPKYVLLVTDGQPNCVGGDNGGGNAQAVTDSVNAIQAMTADGIKTYVLGYGTQADSDATAALNEMAAAGGTGDQQYRPINDEASLLEEFQKITGAVISCAFTLDTPPDNPDYVSVAVDGVQLVQGDPNGWVISADRRVVTIQGTSCDTIKSGPGHTLKVQVECNVVTLR